MKYIALLLVLFSTQLFAQTKTIKGDDYSYKCPKNWTPKHFNGILAVVTPMEGADDNFGENLNIVSQPMTMFNSVSLDEYVKINITQLEASGVSGIQRSNYIAGKKKLQGYLITYTTNVFSKGAFDQKLWQIFVLYHNKYFVVTYSSADGSFARYLPEMEKVVSTIVFK